MSIWLDTCTKAAKYLGNSNFRTMHLWQIWKERETFINVQVISWWFYLTHFDEENNLMALKVSRLGIRSMSNVSQKYTNACCTLSLLNKLLFTSMISSREFKNLQIWKTWLKWYSVVCIQELLKGRAYFKNFNCQKQLIQNIDQFLHQVQHWCIEMALLSTSSEKLFMPVGLLQDSLWPGDEAKEIIDPFRYDYMGKTSVGSLWKLAKKYHQDSSVHEFLFYKLLEKWLDKAFYCLLIVYKHLPWWSWSLSFCEAWDNKDTIYVENFT